MTSSTFVTQEQDQHRVHQRGDSEEVVVLRSSRHAKRREFPRLQLRNSSTTERSGTARGVPPEQLDSREKPFVELAHYG
jgi:hypothetical protein